MARKQRTRGVSLLELLVSLVVLMVLASAVIPVYRWDEKRRREARLRASLTQIRFAIDKYNEYMAEGLIQLSDIQQCALPAALDTCWPLTLEQLVDGVEVGDPQSPDLQIVKFLHRLPTDPFMETGEWGLRSFQDDWDANSWGGENVYDVYSLSDKIALDGTYYSEW
jgi:general secretion pathway protein G